jgi:hypothetical protein
MPHQVAAATGCELEEAMEVLMLLYDQYLAEALLLVYHNEHLDAPATAVSISEGLPSLPFICSVCEKGISDPKELSYDFLFRLNGKILFVVENDESN